MKVLLCAFIVFSSSVIQAEISAEITRSDAEPVVFEDQLQYGMSLWVTPGLALLGFEVQRGNYSVGVGIPATLYGRYLPNAGEDGAFIDAYVGQNTREDAEDNRRPDIEVEFDRIEDTYAGIGYGYLWQWDSGINFAASAFVQYSKINYTDEGRDSALDWLIFKPGIKLGYRF